MSAFLGRFVHVFSWAGSFDRVFELDADLLSITLDSSAQVLYAVRHDPTPAILEYSLMVD